MADVAKGEIKSLPERVKVFFIAHRIYYISSDRGNVPMLTFVYSPMHNRTLISALKYVMLQGVGSLSECDSHVKS